mgnify:FL=1
MSVESDFPQEFSGPRKGNTPSAGWFVALGILLVANLLMWFYPPMQSFRASVFSILSIVALAYSGAFRKYRRLIYAMIVPGLLAWTLAGHGFYWLANSSQYRGPGAAFVRGLAGGPTTESLVSFVVGLVAGIVVPMLILEGYVFLNKDVVQAFSGLEMSTVHKILRSLFLNLQRPYYMVKDGEISRTRPQGLSLIGGPGLVIVAPGNAVVFEHGGKLKRVELGGVHKTKKFERIYKVIRLTSRSNLTATPTPTYPTPDMLPARQPEPAQGERNIRRVRSKDGIYIDLDFVVYFQIRRRSEPSQDKVLAQFTSQEVRQVPDPYFVDKNDVFKAATSFNHWELAVSAIAEDVLRDIVAQYDLDQLFEPPANPEPQAIRDDRRVADLAEPEIEMIRNLPKIRGKICQEIRDRMNRMVNGDGIEVTYVSIGAVDVPPEVRERLQEEWLARNRVRLAEAERAALLVSSEAEKEARRIRAQGDAEAIKLIEQARASAQQRFLTALGRILDESKIKERELASYMMISLRLIQALQEAAAEPSAKLLFPYGMPFEDIEKTIRGLLEDKQAASGALASPESPTVEKG